ncbi:MAG: hypothetical protein M1269_07665 [Chloroflexi bacterium]|nr:hypothetical protein [Chloroflexota bacterium]
MRAPGEAVEADNIVAVEGGDKSAPGKFYLTTIFQQQANVLLTLGASVFPDWELVPQSKTGGKCLSTYDREMKEQMAESKIMASIAALKYSGYKIPIKREGVIVMSLLPESKSKGIIQRGDLVIFAGGKKVHSSEGLASILKDWPEDKKIPVIFEREKSAFKRHIELINYHGRKIIGFRPLNYVEVDKLPVKIDIKTHFINGSSAGLIFSLEIIRQLKGVKFKDEKIAGSGTIDAQGNVGEVEGIDLKLKGARNVGAKIFLIPEGQYKEYKDKTYGMKLIPVKNLSSACRVLSARYSGKNAAP